MRLATGGTHAHDTPRKGAGLYSRVLTQEAAPPLSFGAADFRDFIYQKPALDRGFISATRKRTRTSTTVTPISESREYNDRNIRYAYSAVSFTV